jgi:hypothetical protein
MSISEFVHLILKSLLASERELLRKVVELNTVVEKSTRDNDRFKSELMRLHEGQEHEMVAWQQREADLEQVEAEVDLWQKGD